MAKNKSIEEKYQTMSELDHILARPGMYVGSIKNEIKQLFIYSIDDAKMELVDVEYTPALLKMLDEIISNSCDEYRRKDNLGLNEMSVTLYKHGKVIVKDNGGIPVVKHKEAGIYVPEFIFGNLRTSSNYDDTEDRDVIGTNGIGAKLCNVFSTDFSIYTADKKHSYYRSWKNNMKDINNDMEVKSTKEHFTESTFTVDFSKFECGNEFSEDFINIIEKRCIDAAAANIGLSVTFKFIDDETTIREKTWLFESFTEYIELYAGDLINMDDMLTYENNTMKLWIFPDNGINIGFVNGAECSKGTHIRGVRNEINNAISSFINQKHKIDIGATKNVDGKYSLFCDFHVNNPSYDSQTKECLTTPIEKFDTNPKYKFTITDTFLKDICKSEITNLVLDWYKQKQEAEDQKTIRKLNKEAKKKVRNSEKFIDCTSKRREERELWIFEGNSASSSFRTARFPDKQCGYLLRGKILNVSGLSPSKIMENRELSDLVNIIGLQWGEKTNVKDLKVGKIVICTDADEDGSAIAGLLLNFFNIWPELYEEQIICRSITPIIVAKKVNDVKKYYTLPEYKAEEHKLKGYTIKYLKGLGSQTDDLARDMFQRPIFHYFTKDEMADLSLRSWFGKGNAADRKSMLKKDVEG